MKKNNLFFISNELITRKQLFQIIDMGYHTRSFFIGQLQSDGSIWNPKRMNKLIYTEFFTFLPKHFVIFTQVVIYIHWRSEPIEDKSISFKFFLIVRTLFASFRLENLTMTPFGLLLGNQWQPSMLEEPTSKSSFLNNRRALPSSSEFSIDSGRPLSSKHSRLEYWQLLIKKFLIS